MIACFTAGLSLSQITGIVIALCIGGGIMIRGNIPNIAAAGRLKIRLKEWAATEVPIGLLLVFVSSLMLYSI